MLTILLIAKYAACILIGLLLAALWSWMWRPGIKADESQDAKTLRLIDAWRRGL